MIDLYERAYELEERAITGENTKAAFEVIHPCCCNAYTL